jgi:peptidoglycan/LPS O-acetylase OafA/YrhL
LAAAILVTLGRDIASAHWLFYLTPPFRLFDFVLGVACGLYFLNSPRINLTSTTWTLLELACLAGILTMVLLSSYFVHQSYRYGVYYMPVFCATIFVFAHQGGWLSKILSGKTWVLLGEISFAFYMFHQLVFRYLNELSHGKLGYVYYPIGASLLAFAITLALSYVSFTYYEKFTRNLVRNTLSSRS